MDRRDIEAFFADEEDLDRETHVFFTYIFETAIEPREAAAHLCQETSTAQWKRPDVDEDFRPLHAAKVVNLDVLDESFSSVFVSDQSEKSKFVRVRVRIAHPYGNFGRKIPNLLTTALGEGVFFCNGINTIKLVDIDFPESFLADFDGPRFGTKGIRTLLDVFDRPLFIGVVKPNVGLDPVSFANIAHEALVGGLDVAKDDEMLADADYSPFGKRMQFVGRAIQSAQELSGEKKMFIANITDEIDNLIRLHDIAIENGINAVMVNAMAIGLSAIRMLRKNVAVPIFAHFDCIAPMSRHPYFGVSTTVITKLQRLCGCDCIVMPGFGERMMTPDEEVIANCTECSRPLGVIKSVLPVPGGGDWAGTLPLMYERLHTLDFAMVPGRGVFSHPAGPKAGAKSLRQAWDAIVQRVDLNEYALTHPELAAAIEAFGPVPEARQQDLSKVVYGFTGASLELWRN